MCADDKLMSEALGEKEISGGVVHDLPIDFKTDREFGLFRAEYPAQVALYAEAIQRATNSLANGIMLVF
jgi:hypothetical protein